MKESAKPPTHCLHQSHARRGATTVEFAMVSIVLVLLIFGGIEMTRMSMLRHTVDHAAYVAARNAIIPGAKASDVIAAAERHLDKVGLTGAVVTVDPEVITDESSVVEVLVRLPIAENSFAAPDFLYGDLIGRSALMTERAPIQMSGNLREPPPPPEPPTPDPPPSDDGDDDDGDDNEEPAAPPEPPPEPAPTPML